MESIKEYLKKHFYVGAALLIGIVTAFLAVINPFYALDAYLTDKLYTKLTGTDSDIIIIGVDEETLAEYGNFNLWSREKSAELLEYLHEDETNCPAVVGLDFMFIDSYDEEVDARLAKAAALYDGQVVLGTNVVYRGALETDENGKRYFGISKKDLPETDSIHLKYSPSDRSVSWSPQEIISHVVELTNLYC